MSKISLRIEIDEKEQETLDKLKIVFNENTRNKVIRKLLVLSRDKYL